MNVYDTANKLAGEIKQSEEYMNYKMAKQALSLNSKLKEQLQEFEKIRYEVQVELMQTGKNNEEKYKTYYYHETEISNTSVLPFSIGSLRHAGCGVRKSSFVSF